MLFEAFVSAFMKFASEHVYCSGQSNMLYQPEFADIEKLKELMKMLEDSSLFDRLQIMKEMWRLKLAEKTI